MKRLFHIVVLTLALLGLTAPGWAADTALSRCSRGAIWSHSPAVAGLPAPVEVSVLPAPMQTSICPDHAIAEVAALMTIAPRRGPLPLASTMPGLPGALSEAELPPPRQL